MSTTGSFAYLVTRPGTDLSSFIAAFTLWINTFISTSDIINFGFSTVTKMALAFYDSFVVNEVKTPKLKAESLSGTFKSVKKFVKNFTSAAFFKGIKEMLTKIISFKLYGKDFSGLVKGIFTGKCNFFDLVESILGGIVVLTRSAESLLSGNSLTSAFLDDHEVEKIILESKLLLLKYDSGHVFYGVPHVDHLSAVDFVHRGTQAMKEFEEAVTEDHIILSDPTVPCLLAFNWP